jgi:DNA-binding CsgD family transcriptional regulator
MHRLAHRDHAAVLRFLSACDSGAGLQAFAASVTAALPALIAADVAVFGMANPRARVLQAIENPRVTTAAELDTWVRVSVTQRTPNPPVDHFARTNDPEARRLSDFLTRRQFHALPVYTEFYRPLRIEFVLGAFINNGPTAFDGVTLNRAGRDFTERDRSVLTILRPHIVQGYRTAIAIDRLRADLALAARAVETPGFGLIVISACGRMDLLSPGAEALLTKYFGPRRQAEELPDTLDGWVRQNVEAARDSSRLPPPDEPLIVERPGARLVVQPVRIGRDTLLLLEEPTTRSNWLRLAPLGLPLREARVLLECLREEVVMAGSAMTPDPANRVIAWFREVQALAPAAHRLTPHEVRLLGLLVDGHGYKTAAAALGSSVHTVAFHMKHIYEKLQAHSKSEAVAKALRDRIVP